MNEIISKLSANIKHVIKGKDTAIQEIITALIADGHVLIEDVPGVGKTMLAKTMAKSISGSFKRIQFTADILPTDITGISIYNQKEQAFEFQRGPIFANIVLADEINRGTPRAQSSMLECMGEKQVSMDLLSFELPKPFLVIGTQNPIEFEGTYPLLEGELDRFMIYVSLGYPERDAEIEIMKSQTLKQPLDEISPVVSLDEILKIQEKVRHIEVSHAIYEYIVDIIHWTRNQDEIKLGASPRGSLALRRCAQALALLSGREFVIPDDIKRIAPKVLAHRLIIKSEAEISGVLASDLVDKCMKEIEININDD